MDIINKILIKVFCTKIGSDEFGNQYFESKKNKRYIIYNGISEPSKIPAKWHRWIHYTTNNPPNNTKTHLWQKIHLPNLTGTNFAYSPLDNKIKKDKVRKKVSSDYQSWKPN